MTSNDPLHAYVPELLAPRHGLGLHLPHFEDEKMSDMRSGGLKMRNCNWRDIPANSIAWRDNEISSIAGGKVHRMCSEGQIWQDSPFSLHAWQDKTLGEIADMGPRHWRRCTDIGDMAVEVIKWMLDEAAEGRPRMLSRHGQPDSDAYVPKCERDQQ